MSEFKHKVLYDQVVVRPKEKAKETASGIVLPEMGDDDESLTQGTVLAYGPEAPVELLTGHDVVHNKYAGVPYTIDGDPVLIMAAREIVMVLA